VAGPGVPIGVRNGAVMSNADLFAFLAGLSDGAVDVNALGGAGPVFYSTERGLWDGTHPAILLGAENERFALHFAPETDTWRLYDRIADPEQRVDVAAEHPDVLAELLAALLERATRAEANRLSSGDFGDGEGALEALRDIGYL
jgi:hypothetical protein